MSPSVSAPEGTWGLSITARYNVIYFVHVRWSPTLDLAFPSPSKDLPFRSTGDPSDPPLRPWNASNELPQIPWFDPALSFSRQFRRPESSGKCSGDFSRLFLLQFFMTEFESTEGSDGIRVQISGQCIHESECGRSMTHLERKALRTPKYSRPTSDLVSVTVSKLDSIDLCRSRPDRPRNRPLELQPLLVIDWLKQLGSRVTSTSRKANSFSFRHGKLALPRTSGTACQQTGIRNAPGSCRKTPNFDSCIERPSRTERQAPLENLSRGGHLSRAGRSDNSKHLWLV